MDLNDSVCYDTHTHHRDPGFTHKEDITTATMAAAAGGVTFSIGMPNVNPPTTNVERYRALVEHHSKNAIVDFNHNPSGTVPRNSRSRQRRSARIQDLYGQGHRPGLPAHARHRSQ